MSSTEINHLSTQTLENMRQQMLNFALLQLKDMDTAEDVVQETFINAYKYASSFRGEAALKTWIFAILKNKIIDAIRAKNRVVLSSELANDDESDISTSLFDTKGEWDKQAFELNEWKNIEQTTYQTEFWKVFELCLEHLPANQARVFMMRNYLELKTEEICEACDISVANLHTILYRARLQLQVCLSQKWFGG